MQIPSMTLWSCRMTSGEGVNARCFADSNVRFWRKADMWRSGTDVCSRSKRTFRTARASI